MLLQLGFTVTLITFFRGLLETFPFTNFRSLKVALAFQILCPLTYLKIVCGLC